MSVILEFTIDNEDFQLGQVLSQAPHGMRLELERIVPTGTMIMPFVWATGANHDEFETRVRDHPLVKDIILLDRIGDSSLYRIEWDGEPTNLNEGIVESDAVVLEARGDENWVFRLRFPNHDKLSRFHNYVIEHDIPIHMERTYTLTEETERGFRFDLSREQREALVLALQRGYFETPSQVSLDALATELGVSQQAVSNRIRLGTEQILRKTLLDSVSDMG